MGIEAAVLGGASLIGSAMDRRAAGKATNKANEAAMARTQAGLAALTPGFQASQNVRQQALGMGNQMRQQGMEQGLGMIGQLYGPTAGMQQAGDGHAGWLRTLFERHPGLVKAPDAPPFESICIRRCESQ